VIELLQHAEVEWGEEAVGSRLAEVNGDEEEGSGHVAKEQMNDEARVKLNNLILHRPLRILFSV